MNKRRAYWITGIVISMSGVGMVRLLTDAVTEPWKAGITIAGYLFAFAGLFVITLAPRQRQ